MKKHYFDGKQYIALGEFDHLRRNLVRDIYDQYEKDENGQIHLSEIDMGRIDAYTHIMSAIMEEDCAKDSNNGETVYFRKMCGEDGDTPTFTTQKRKAMEYDNYYHATSFLAYLKDRLDYECGLADLRVMPLYLAYMTDEEAKKLLDAIFRDENDDGSGCGQAFSPD